MTNKNTKKKPVIEEEYYHNLFSNDENRQKALEIALDTRKFEIDMYWKRATYFWAFIAAAFAGYFAVLSSNSIDCNRVLTVLISGIGFCFSLGWYFVNRGSKFWQENWEAHVARLEITEPGPLFSAVKIPTDSFIKCNGHYSFSVSKINQILSLITTFIWIIMFVGSVLYTFEKTNDWQQIVKQYGDNYSVYSILIASLIVLLGIGIIIFFKTLAFTQKEFCSKPKGAFFLNTDTPNIEMSNYLIKDSITMGNDEFILYVRKKNHLCEISTKELGKLIWLWIKEHDKSAIQAEQDMECYWETKSGAKNISEKKLPKTATQFTFRRSLISKLYAYLDDLSEI